MSEDSGKGFIKLYRKIMDNRLWKQKPFSNGQAWIDLLLLAKYKDEKFDYQEQVVVGKRGVVHLSIMCLAERWGWSRDKARRFLNRLQSDGMVTVNATKHLTTITIENYGFFQDKHTTNRQPIDNEQYNQPTTNRQQADTYKKEEESIRKDKKVEEVICAQSDDDDDSRPQTPEEIEECKRWFESLKEQEDEPV